MQKTLGTHIALQRLVFVCVCVCVLQRYVTDMLSPLSTLSPLSEYILLVCEHIVVYRSILEYDVLLQRIYERNKKNVAHDAVPK